MCHTALVVFLSSLSLAAAVLATRPFSETLQSVFGGLLERLGNEDIDLPLLESREVTCRELYLRGNEGSGRKSTVRTLAHV